MKAIGLLYLILLYIACFVFVNLIRFAMIGIKSFNESRSADDGAEKEQKEQPQEQPQPVYYIVEKKKPRGKASYSKPREIKFSDER